MPLRFRRCSVEMKPDAGDAAFECPAQIAGIWSSIRPWRDCHEPALDGVLGQNSAVQLGHGGLAGQDLRHGGALLSSEPEVQRSAALEVLPPGANAGQQERLADLDVADRNDVMLAALAFFCLFLATLYEFWSTSEPGQIRMLPGTAMLEHQFMDMRVLPHIHVDHLLGIL